MTAPPPGSVGTLWPPLVLFTSRIILPKVEIVSVTLASVVLETCGPTVGGGGGLSPDSNDGFVLTVSIPDVSAKVLLIFNAYSAHWGSGPANRKVAASPWADGVTESGTMSPPFESTRKSDRRLKEKFPIASENWT